MESVRNWLEQTIGMPIDYICIIIMGIEDITITGWQPGGNYEGTITEKEQERQ